MTSFIIKPLTLLSNYQSKAVDVHHNDTRLSNAPGSKMLQMNVIEQGVLPGGNNGDNRSVRVRYDQSAKLEGFRVNAPKFY